MAVIHFKELLMPEAEQCVAEIWICLEKYHIPSPIISLEFCYPLRTRITLNIDDPVAENTLRARLSDWVEEQNDRFVRKQPRQLWTYNQAVGRDSGAAPINFVLALAAATKPGPVFSRLRRK